ncbi:hypothetical protein Tsp_07259 [Trichinella spiralis]|uniref:hypothetical protein n=1 Tax=Trichinella spiralis TaxID=6334 RepID=UPI0001EFC32F|nr:hypothetical protein Tsp_13648 [Trichinella spiralis]XP_003381572.1 hypothetical protein Tsp_07259 [Trichinella spiralis]
MNIKFNTVQVVKSVVRFQSALQSPYTSQGLAAVTKCRMPKQKKESLQRYVTTAQNSFRVHKTCAVVQVNTSLSSGYSTELKHMCFACQGAVIRLLRTFSKVE